MTEANAMAYHDALGAVAEEASLTLARLWDAYTAGDAETMQALLSETLPEVISVYGDQAAEVAARLYEAMRREATGRDGATVALADALDDSVVRSVYGLYGGDLDAYLRDLQAMAMRHVLNAARNTIIDAVVADRARGVRVRWARVPHGPKPCDFCVMTASRGFVYHSRETASTSSGGDPYHTHCSCDVVPGFGDTPSWPGYDQGKYEDMYYSSIGVAT
jgi:hypothetical protein